MKRASEEEEKNDSKSNWEESGIPQLNQEQSKTQSFLYKKQQYADFEAEDFVSKAITLSDNTLLDSWLGK